MCLDQGQRHCLAAIARGHTKLTAGLFMSAHCGKGDNHCPGGGQTDCGSESAHLSVFVCLFAFLFIYNNIFIY